jgi:carboxymethylenebutenolidase
MIAKVTIDDALKDVAAALSNVESAGKAGIVGYCWGGTVAFKAACNVPGLRAAISYYGGGVPGLIALKPQCPVMFHWGETDQSIPLDKAKEFAAAHKDQAHYFYAAGHGFNCDQRGSYNAEAAKLARQRTLEFLARHVG